MNAAEAMGLPPGVAYVRIGAVKLDEKYIQDGRILDGPRPGSNIVVTLLPGWGLVYDITSDSAVPAKLFDPPQEHIFRFRISNSLQLDDMLALRKRLVDKGILIEDPAQEGESGAQLQPEVGAHGNSSSADGGANPGPGNASSGSSGA